MSLRYPVIGVFLSLLIPLKLYAQAGAFTLEDWPETAAAMKPVYVKAIMEQAGVHKVSFAFTPEFYANELDKFAAFAQQTQQRTWLKTSVAQSLATIAVIHCDWKNGVAPWDFAKNYLGDKQIEQLKPLYQNEIAHLQQDCSEAAAK